MIDSLLRFAVYHRYAVLALTTVVALLGFFSYQNLPIDAVPDITNVQVQINTEAPGFSPLEVEQRITLPLEIALAGLTKLEDTRSLSRYGLSQITAVFAEGTDIYFARQLVGERLQQVRDKLPKGVTPIMGPVATGLGEIVMYTLHPTPGSELSETELRTIQDWIVRPQLLHVPGVAEVNSIGGEVKQYHVYPRPEALVAYSIDWEMVVTALLTHNNNVSAGYIEINGEQQLVRSPGQLLDVVDIGMVPIATRDGVPVRVQDIAQVVEGSELRTGAATEQGREAVLGTVFMLVGENSRDVAKRATEKLKEIQKTIPTGAELKTVYDRTELVEATINTVQRNLTEGALLVTLILFCLLGSFRAALITACVIPLAFLIAITGMIASGISGNLMSLGALDFGLIVDGAVILVENCVRALGVAEEKEGRSLSLGERLKLVFAASREVRKATIFGELIIMIVYLPILALTGVEGKTFKPMAYTVIFALVGSMLLSMTFVPASVAVLLRRGHSHGPSEWLLSWLSRYYATMVGLAINYRRVTLAAAISIVVATLPLTINLGTEFMPSLDEGDIALHALRIPGTSLTQAISMQQILERQLMDIPEVENSFSKIGTADIATDPMPPSVADGYVMMKPRSAWPDPRLSKGELVKRIEARVLQVPGNNYEFTQPIQMRFNELLSGVRSDVAIKVFGDDMAVLEEVGEQISRVVAKVPGASDVKLEPVTGLPFVSLDLKREALSRYGVSVARVQGVIEAALGGTPAGAIFEGDRRFQIVVRLSDELRSNIDQLLQMPLLLGPNVEGAQSVVPLGELVDVSHLDGPNQISRENGKRRVTVTANVRGGDLGSLVHRAREVLATQVAIPVGYWVGWGGQFEHLIEAKNRLFLVASFTLLLIFSLLYFSLGSVRDTLVVFSGIPFALTGGVMALHLRQINFSISAGVGFVALSGVAVLNGLVMVSFITQLRREGQELGVATKEGAIRRLRPVLMTALVASLGFIPMAISTGIGSEVQRPLATVVIGGIISSTILTLLVLPTLYLVAHGKGGSRIAEANVVK